MSCSSWVQAQQRAGKGARPSPVGVCWLLSKRADSPGAFVVASVVGVVAVDVGRVRVAAGQVPTASATERFPS